MNSRTFLRKAVVVFILPPAFVQALFAATMDKDFTLNDGTGVTVDADKITFRQYTKAVGVAWESSNIEGDN